MMCETCKYWKPTYAPFVLHGVKQIMTCHKDKPTSEVGKCKYWEPKNEEQTDEVD